MHIKYWLLMIMLILVNQINCEIKYDDQIKQIKIGLRTRSSQVKSYKYGIWNRIGKRRDKLRKLINY